MDSFLKDILFGLRMLASRPGFTAVAVIALALGIGINTAIFSVINAVLLTPPPYHDPDRLVMVWEHNRPRSRPHNVINPANFLDWREQSRSFEQLAAFHDARFNLTEVEDPEELSAQVVTTNLFDLLGIAPVAGRQFESQDAEADGERTTILSHGLWTRRFGSDASIVGRTISLNGAPFTVIAIMPAAFEFFVRDASLTGEKPELWVPMRFTPDHQIRRGRYLSAIGRLKPGITIEQAKGEMDSIAANLEREHSEFNAGWGVNLVRLHQQISGTIRPALLILMGAVCLVLLIACANVASLLLARATARRRETAVRVALGASRGRLMRQWLTESLLLSLVGAGPGFLLAIWGVDVLKTMSPPELALEAGLDLRVLGFTIIVSVLTAVLFGIAPAVHASRADVGEALKESGPIGSAGRARGALVVGELALAVVLLAGAGLLIRSFALLQSVDPGFDPRNVVAVSLQLPGSKYRESTARVEFYRNLLERVRSTPGVISAGAISFLPFRAAGAATSYLLVGKAPPPPNEPHVADVRVVTSSYFETMGIPLLQGRHFTEKEVTEASRVVIINETMARAHWPDESPLGQKVIINMSNDPQPSEIIGVVRDVKIRTLDETPRAMTYWPHPELAYSGMNLVIKLDGAQSQLAPLIISHVRSIDRDQPVADIRTMDELLARSLAGSRFNTTLLSIFAALALILAAVGLYGVLSYSISQRTREIGLRMALGARPTDVVRMVLRQGMLLCFAGTLVGLVAAWLLTRMMESILYAVTPGDPVTFVMIPLLAGLVALVATLIPAYRATRVDPMLALRHQ